LMPSLLFVCQLSLLPYAYFIVIAAFLPPPPVVNRQLMFF